MSIFQPSSRKHVVRDIVGKRGDITPPPPPPPKKEKPVLSKNLEPDIRRKRKFPRLSFRFLRLPRRRISPQTPPRAPASRKKLVVVAASVIILVVLFLVGVRFFASAIVRIEPKQEIKTIERTLRGAITGGDIPIELMRVEESLRASVPTTGEEIVNQKSSGKIIIYNAFSADPQALVRNTRFQAPDGKMYRIDRSITVPGMRTVNGETVPGSLEVTVSADQPGEEYNIGLVDFTVPGFTGTPRFAKFFARSKTAMTGGFIGRTRVVTQEDVSVLRNRLEQQLRVRLREKASLQIPEDFLLFDDAREVFITVKEAIPEAGAAGATLTMDLSGTLSAFLIRRQDIERALAARVFDGAVDTYIANINDLGISVETRDVAKKEIVFRVRGDAHFVWNTVDAELLKRELIASRGAYTTAFKKYPSIIRAEIIFRPSWWKFFPRNIADIAIEQIIRQ